MLGSLVGILGGPLGVLFAGTTGTLIGSLTSLDTVDTRMSLLEQMSSVLQPGHTAVFADVQEGAVEVIDKIAKELNCVILLRRPAEAVLAEVQLAADAQRAAEKEARKLLREQHKAEALNKFDGWKDEVGQKWQHLKKTLNTDIKDL